MTSISIRKPECLRAPLPRLTFLEASAGTGKTWTLERIVVDLLLTSGLSIQQILLVTFTRKAAADMAERVRNCLTELLKAPEVAAAHEPAWKLDDIARARLEQALADFDQASISTIHSFCQRVLDEQVVLAGILRDPSPPHAEALLHDAFNDTLRRVARTDSDARTFLHEWRLLGRDIEDLEDLVLGARAHVVEADDPLARFEGHINDDVLRRSQNALFECIEEKRPSAADIAAELPRVQKMEPLFGTFDALATIAEDPRRMTLPPRALQLHLLNALDAAMDTTWKAFLEPDAQKGPVHALCAAMRACYLAGPTVEALALATFLPDTMRAFQSEAQRRGVTDQKRLLTDTRDVLRADEALGVLHERIRARYRAVLVDEFQDTDEVQWEILHRLFVAPPSDVRVAVVGDPKQAIYAFRGGDLQTYVTARATMSAMGQEARLIPLKGNHRSTPEMVDAYNTILLSTPPKEDPFFGDASSGVTYNSSTAVTAEGNVGKLTDASGAAVVPLGVVHVENHHPRGHASTGSAAMRNPDESVGQQVMRAFVHEAARLVHQPNWIVSPKGDRRRVVASDLMVLTNKNAEAARYVEALSAAGVLAEQYRADHLLSSDEASDIADILEGLAQPHGRAPFVKALRTVFFQVPFDELEQHAALPRDDARVQTWERWVRLAHTRDWARLFSDIRRAGLLARRAALSPVGERRWLAIQAILDVVHRMARDACPDITTLAQRVRAEVDGDAYNDVDDDDQIFPSSAGRQAARVLTIFKAKGLEAPIVFCALAPFSHRNTATFHTYHGGVPIQRRHQWTGSLTWAPCGEAVKTEAEHESRRLQYVALTRATFRLWLPLVTRPPRKSDLKKKSVTPQDRFPDSVGDRFNSTHVRLFHLLQNPQFAKRVERVEGAAPTMMELPPISPLPHSEPPVVAQTGRQADEASMLARGLELGSYTALHKSLHRSLHSSLYSSLYSSLHSSSRASIDAGFGSAEGKETRDPGTQALPAIPIKPVAAEVTSDQMPRGRQAGDLMHRFLEQVPLHTVRVGQDFDRWRAEPAIAELCAEMWRYTRWTEAQRTDTERLVHGALHAPVHLADDVVIPGLGTLGHALHREVPFRMAWPTTHQPLGVDVTGRWMVERGHLKGAIDFAFEHVGRVWFGDWKSNALASYDDTTLRASVAASYDAQVRIYTLVLCRLYGLHTESAYAARFGGALYIYTRGVPHGGGVVRVRPTWTELRELDALLADRRALVPPAARMPERAVDTPEDHEETQSRADDEHEEGIDVDASPEDLAADGEDTPDDVAADEGASDVAEAERATTAPRPLQGARSLKEWA